MTTHEYANQHPAPRPPEPDAEEIDLAGLWTTIRAGIWKIAGFTLGALVLAVFYLFVTSPVYRANALLQIKSEDSSPLQGITSELKKFAGKSPALAASEMQIIKSRSVVGEAIKELDLDTVAQPIYFPIIGNAVARRRTRNNTDVTREPGQANGWLPNYAWAPTQVEVTRFEVPDRLLGHSFTLRALGGKRFVLLGPDGQPLLAGQVGRLAEGKGPYGGGIRLFVQRLDIGVPPVDFTLAHRKLKTVFSSLASRLSVTEQGDETGVVQIALQGEDPEEITHIVNSVAKHYLRQNVEARSKQAKKSLDFLNQQLPELKSKVDAAESKLARYQKKNSRSADLNAEGKALLDQMVALEDKQSQMKMKMAELRQTYTGRHPSVEAAREQMQQLKAQRQQLNNKIDKLPEAQKDVLRLRRNVKVNTQLYTTLLNRAQELRVVKAGTVGNARIIDTALVPVQAVSPRTKLVLVMALLIGIALGCIYVIARAALRRAVDDPKDIENQLGLPVYAVVPFSAWLERRSRRVYSRTGSTPILARDHGEDVAVEAIRSLRTSLYFARMDTGSNVILVTGPAPGVGKSFISVNLGYLQADLDQSVVVVDADMRRGQLHHFIPEGKREPGLSQVLTGQVGLDDALRPLPETKAYILPTGRIPPNPSELLMREQFSQTLHTLKQRFDLVIIDAPPVLAVTDAAIIAGALSDIVTFIVARAGMHPIRELEECVNRLSQHDRKVAGVVFNAYRQEHADYSGSYSYYQYEYKSSR